MNISGIISGTLGYNLHREFLANSIALREVQQFNYEIYSVDLATDANTIQNQIKNQFSQIYSGDVHCTVFQTQNTYSFPSDSLKASKYSVTVEVKSPVANLGVMFPELSGAYYSGLDTNFITSYGQYLLEFKENFTF